MKRKFIFILLVVSSCRSPENPSDALVGCFRSQHAPYIFIKERAITIEGAESYSLKIDYSKSGYSLISPPLELHRGLGKEYVFMEGKLPYYFWEVKMDSNNVAIYVIAEDHRKFRYQKVSPEQCA